MQGEALPPLQHTECGSQESWPCPWSGEALGKVGPVPHLISTVVLALAEGQWVSKPQGQSEEKLALLLALCPFSPCHLRQSGMPTLESQGRVSWPCPLLAAAPAELSGQCYRAYLGDVGVGVGAGDLEG